MSPRPRSIHRTPLGRILDERNIQSSALAEAMGLSRSGVQRWVDGTISLRSVSVDTVERIVAALVRLAVPARRIQQFCREIREGS